MLSYARDIWQLKKHHASLVFRDPMYLTNLLVGRQGPYLCVKLSQPSCDILLSDKCDEQLPPLVPAPLGACLKHCKHIVILNVISKDFMASDLELFCFCILALIDIYNY